MNVLGAEFYKKAKKRVTAAEKSGKYHSQLEIYKKDGLKYPPGSKVFSYPKDMISLEEKLTIFHGFAYLMVVSGLLLSRK